MIELLSSLINRIKRRGFEICMENISGLRVGDKKICVVCLVGRELHVPSWGPCS